MRRAFAAIFTLAVACASTDASAVNAAGTCRVVAGEKLLVASGGAGALCDEIHKAVAAAAPKVRYSAEVRALSPSRLAATLVVNGKALPEQNFAVMDRNLSTASIREFAESLAQEVARAAKR